MNTITYVLFENPWPLVAPLAVIGLICAFLARRRGPNFRFAAAGLLIGAAGLTLLSQAVRTDRETIIGQLRGLAAQVSAGKYEELRELLADTVHVHAGSESVAVDWSNRDIRGYIGRRMDELGASGVQLSNLDVTVEGETATASFTAALLQDETVIYSTQWRIGLAPFPEDDEKGRQGLWQITEVWAPEMAQ
jgi:hypothetical protein